MRIRRFREVVPALALTVALAACGGAGDDTSPPDDAAADAADTEELEAGTDPDGAADGGDEAGSGATGTWCDWLDTAEVEAMFDGALELTEQRPVNDAACQWTITGAEGEGLMAGEVTPGTFELLLQQGESQSAPMEEPDLGEGAVLLNDADLTVLRAGATEFRVALSAFFTDPEQVPDPAVVRAGILELGAVILDETG